MFSTDFAYSQLTDLYNVSSSFPSGSGGPVSDKPLHSVVKQAESLSESIAETFAGKDFERLFQISDALKEMHRRYDGTFKNIKDFSHFNAAVGMALVYDYAAAEICGLHRTVDDERKAIIKLLLMALRSGYQHPHQFQLKKEVAFQADQIAKQLSKSGDLQSALKYFSLSIEMLESIPETGDNSFVYDCCRRCAHGHSHISSVYHKLGLEEKRVPHLVRAIELFEKCLADETAPRKELMQTLNQLIFQISFLGNIYEKKGNFAVAAKMYSRCIDLGQHYLPFSEEMRPKIYRQLEVNKKMLKAVNRKYECRD